MELPTADVPLPRDASPAATSPVQVRRINPMVPLLMVLGLFVSLRAGLSVLAWASLALMPLPESWRPAVAHWVDLALRPGDPLYYVIGPWQRWDALWYERIATFGYAAGDNTTHFFPLFPLLMRVVGLAVEGRWALAGLVVSGVSLVAGLYVLWQTVAADVNPGVAWRTILYISVFPTAFFFFAPFTEALFLCLAVTSFYCSRRGKWGLAGAFGFLAALTRPHGVALIVPLAWEYGRQKGWRLRALVSRDVLHLPLVPLAPLLFAAYVWIAVGESFASLELAGQGWGETLRPPWQTLWNSLQMILSFSGPKTNYLDFVVTVVFLALSLACFRYLPTSYGLLGLALLLPRLLISNPETPLLGASRYALVAFPCFVLVGMAGRYRLFNRLYLAGAIVGLGVLTAFFVRWAWIA